MPEKTTRSGVGEAWLAQRESLWTPRLHLGVGTAPLCNFIYAARVDFFQRPKLLDALP
jgi:hypothetical protein